MARTATIRVYAFNELSDTAKDRARDVYRAAADQDHDYAECAIEGSILPAAERLGITFATQPIKLYGGWTRQDPIIWWALHQQGGGASFSGSWAYTAGSVDAIRAEYPTETDLHRIAERLEVAGRAGAIEAGIKCRDIWQREITVYTADGAELYEDTAADRERRQTVVQALTGFMRWIHDAIEGEYDSRQTNAYVDEQIENNEYEYTVEGGRWTRDEGK